MDLAGVHPCRNASDRPNAGFLRSPPSDSPKTMSTRQTRLVLVVFRLFTPLSLRLGANPRPRIGPEFRARIGQVRNESTRGASFEQARVPGERGYRDFLVYLDGEKERVALTSLPVMTKVRVLHLFANASPEAVAPRVLEAEHNEGTLVEAATGATLRRSLTSRLFS